MNDEERAELEAITRERESITDRLIQLRSQRAADLPAWVPLPVREGEPEATQLVDDHEALVEREGLFWARMKGEQARPSDWPLVLDSDRVVAPPGQHHQPSAVSPRAVASQSLGRGFEPHPPYSRARPRHPAVEHNSPQTALTRDDDTSRSGE
eukprot:gene1802-2117_t